MSERLPVRRTAKLFIGGAFPRSESGRSYELLAHNGRPMGWAALASRKDLRDAVFAARTAQGGWANLTAYNRGQILYRVAELMEGRRAQFEAELGDAGATDPSRGVSAAIDRWIWYAGWADKIHQVLGSANRVAGPYFNFTIPEPTGVVGIVAPQDQSLLGLVSRLAPARHALARHALARLVPARLAPRRSTGPPPPRSYPGWPCPRTRTSRRAGPRSGTRSL